MAMKKAFYCAIQLTILVRWALGFSPQNNQRSSTKNLYLEHLCTNINKYRGCYPKLNYQVLKRNTRLCAKPNFTKKGQRGRRDEEANLKGLQERGLDLSHLDFDVGEKYTGATFGERKGKRSGRTEDFDFDLPQEGAWPQQEKKKVKKTATPKATAKRKFSRLPAGVNKKLLDLSLDDLEKRIEGKFKQALRETEEFYDEDDEGFGNPNLELEDVGEAEDPAKFRMRPVQEPVKESPLASPTQPKAKKKEKKKAKNDDDAVVKSQTEKTEKKKKEKKKKDTPIPLDPSTIDSSKIISLEGLGYVGDWEGIPSFEESGITNPTIRENLLKMGIITPTSVQANAIKSALSGVDVTIKAYTGSGKTLAFLLPLLMSIDPEENHIQAIIVAPSRELGAQIHNVLAQVAEDTGIRTQSLIGGANVIRQIDSMKKKKPHIVVGTPGRLAELAFKSKRLRLGMVRHIVLDEVDMLLKATFRSEIEQLIEGMGSRRQVIFSSATGDSQIVKKAMEEFMDDGILVGGRSTGNGKAEVLPSNLAHTYVVLPDSKRLDTLRRFMHTQPFPESAIVFVNDQRKVDILVEKLYEMGIIAAPLHGESSKEDRRDVIKRLQDGRLAMVISTELAARGLDIPQLSHVINYDLPTDGEHYVHRAGRCGRAGNPGIVVTFTTPKTVFVLEKFSRQLGVPFQEIEIKHTRLLIKEDEKPKIKRQ